MKWKCHECLELQPGKRCCNAFIKLLKHCKNNLEKMYLTIFLTKKFLESLGKQTNQNIQRARRNRSRVGLKNVDILAWKRITNSWNWYLQNHKTLKSQDIWPWDIKKWLVSRERGGSLTSWGESASLALTGHPSSDGVTIKMSYRD